MAQSVAGKVTDAKTGEGLPGVAVVVEGANTGVITDMDGMYKIKAATGDVLMYSFRRMQYGPQGSDRWIDGRFARERRCPGRGRCDRPRCEP